MEIQTESGESFVVEIDEGEGGAPSADSMIFNAFKMGFSKSLDGE